MASFTGKFMYKGKQVDVTVEYDPSNVALGDIEKKAIIALVYGKDGKKDHKSSKVKGCPADSEGYLHMPQNQLLAFKNVKYGEIEEDAQKVPKVKKNGSITFTATGSVNSDVHNFKKI